MAAEKISILVIDDDETVLMQLAQILEKGGYLPVCVDNGADGLVKAGQVPAPGAIILDRRMPEMDGNEVLIRLKAEEKTRDIPVLMLTGDKRAGDISTSFELGALDYVVKPFDADNFLLRLRKALTRVQSV